MIWLLYCAAAGLGALLVGMIGFGSSLVILPVLALVFPTQFDPDVALRLATGTTMATMIVGALSAAIAQVRAGAVAWPVLRLMALPYLAGAVLGPWLSVHLPRQVLGGYIAAILVLVGIRSLARPARARTARRWSDARVQIPLVHLLIGLASSVAGIASGVFAIPYLSRFDLPLRTVIGTSTVAATLYSVFATCGYVTAGFGVAARPPFSLGFVYLPAFAAMSVAGAVFGMLGVRLGERVPERWLRRLLSGFLIVSAAVIAAR